MPSAAQRALPDLHPRSYRLFVLLTSPAKPTIIPYKSETTMRQPLIISAARTAIGKFQGALASLSAVELGACVVREAVKRAGIEPAQVDEIIMGNVVSAGLGQNPARQAGLRGGLSPNVAAMTINKVCGSGLKAVALAAQGVQAGDAEIV